MPFLTKNVPHPWILSYTNIGTCRFLLSFFQEYVIPYLDVSGSCLELNP